MICSSIKKIGFSNNGISSFVTTKFTQCEKALLYIDLFSPNFYFLDIKTTHSTCFVEGNIAGNCQILWSNYIKTRHRANVAIALLQEYWNQGIGTRLFKELIKIAENNKYITQIELGFIEGNTRARALYEKMGFRIVSANINAFRFKDGTLRNEYIMIREIKR